MAKVRRGDRAKTKKRTGSTKYPMETPRQIRSAIKLRHHAKGGPGPTTVLKRASQAITRLRKAGRISARTATSLRARLAEARRKDR